MWVENGAFGDEFSGPSVGKTSYVIDSGCWI